MTIQNFDILALCLFSILLTQDVKILVIFSSFFIIDLYDVKSYTSYIST